MKTLIANKLSLFTVGIMGLLPAATVVSAGDTDTNAPAIITDSGPAAAPQLSYGVPQIIRLAQAQIGDSTIIAYIKSSGNSYGLDADQIIYLRQQGISDAVVAAMLSQPKPGVAAATAPPPAAPADNSPAPAPEAQADAAAAPDQTACAPSSSVYIMPDSSPYSYPYPYYYYGGPCYSYPCSAPVVTIIGGRRGGWHGGGGFGSHAGGRNGGHR